MLKEDKEYQYLQEQTWIKPSSRQHHFAGTERETESDGDLAGSDFNDVDASSGKDDWKDA